MREVNEQHDMRGRRWTDREDAILLCYLREYADFSRRETGRVSGEEKHKFAEKIQIKHISILGGRQTRDIHPHLDHLLKLVLGEYEETTLTRIKESDIKNYHRLWL